MTSNSSQIISGALADQLVQNTSVHLNLAQDAIVITEDKVKLCLLEHLAKLESRREWVAPAGILITLLVTFPTTTFNDFIFKAATWQAGFIIAAILTAAWFIRSLVKAWRTPTVDDVVAVMKRTGVSKSVP
ncbi:MAG TPA: hypothetical protein VMB26_11220 [Candidatus Binataceae bacterium]|nr:hypothetical protein [Candidatus Binataceae bacterium]